MTLRNHYQRPAPHPLHVILLSLLCASAMLLACDAVNSITSNPVFICPSPTPDFPFYLYVSPDNFYPPGSTVNLQYYAQSTGVVWLSYTEYDNYQNVLLSGINLQIANAPVGMPGIAGSYPISILPGVTYITGTVIDSVVAIAHPFEVFPNPQLLFPTIPPPWTPVPLSTATPFALTNNFYLGDTVYTTGSTSRIGITLLSVDTVPVNYDDMAFTWTFRITNIGAIEYDFYPYFQSYLSGVSFGGGPLTNNIWVASLALGEQMGYPISVLPVPISPGQSQTFTLFTDGFNVGDLAERFAFVLNPIDHNALSPTVVPGSDIVTFINQPDPYCHAQIQIPSLLPPLTATP